MNVFDHGVEAPERPAVRAVGALVAASLTAAIFLTGVGLLGIAVRRARRRPQPSS